MAFQCAECCPHGDHTLGYHVCPSCFDTEAACCDECVQLAIEQDDFPEENLCLPHLEERLIDASLSAYEDRRADMERDA